MNKTDLQPDIQRELKNITSLIIKYCQPEQVILFGNYTNMENFSELRGYQILVLAQDSEKKINPKLLYKYISDRSDPENRIEKLLFIHIIPIGFFNSEFRHNFFFYSVKGQGILLFGRPCAIIKLKKFKLEAAIERSKADYIRSFDLGKTFLNNAIRAFQENEIRFGAFLIAQAARVFFTGLSEVCIGYSPYRDNYVFDLFRAVRSCSAKLATLFHGDYNEAKYILTKINNLNKNARFQLTFEPTKEELEQYIQAIQEIEQVVQVVCEERINFLIEKAKITE